MLSGLRLLVVSAPLSFAAAALLLQFVQPGTPLAALVVAMVVGTAMLLRPLAVRGADDRSHGIGSLGLSIPTFGTAWATARLLDAPLASRLAWMLGEEDNAHVVGVAREVLTDGPGGAALARQYGTSFASLGAGLLRAGSAGPLTGDPRVDAITATNLSAVVLPFVVAAALLMAASAVRAIRRPDDATASRSRTIEVLVGSLLAGTAALLMIVALPLQLGFMTLAWTVAWVLVGWAALMALHVPGLPMPTRVGLGAQVLAAFVLVEGSWPFLAGALALPALIAIGITLARRDRDATITRRLRRLASIGAFVVALTAAVALASSGAVRTVLGLGREALTAGVEVGSSIVTVGPSLLGAIAVAAALVLGVLRRARALAAVSLAPAAGSLASLAAVWILALAVTDGIVGYGGSKLLLASVMLAAGVAAAMLISGRAPGPGVVAAALILGLVVADPLGRTALGWWDRTAPSEPPHAVATITALEGSSPDLPIRCRPAPGTPATASARLAAYFCIVWMEDAFNPDRESGNRFDFFQTEDETFDRVLAEAEAEGLYGFAYPLRLGPGWFGWDGAS